MPPVNTVLKRFVGLFIPYSLVLAYQGREQRRRRRFRPPGSA
ncbi:MAG: hypothetical protein JWL69_2139 [Phycisphaerales bacterium]|nr:hypothetical protein [Phycisphaerales bacterium]